MAHGFLRARDSLAGRAFAGVLFLAAITLVAGGLLMQSQGKFQRSFAVTTTVSSVGDGLPTGSDVKLRGVIVGRVAGVDARPGRHVVHLDLKPQFRHSIPASVQARILPVNVFGAPYVDLKPSGPETPTLADGMTIAEASDQETLRMQSVLQKVYDVLVAVEPAKLNITLSAIADAMRGNGKTLGTMIDRSERYLARINPQAKVFTEDLRLLAETLRGFDASSADIFAAIDHTAVLARTVVQEQAGLRELLGAGTRAAQQADAFVRTNGPRYVRFADLSARTAATLAPLSPQIRNSLISLGRLAGKIVSILPDEGGAHVRAWVSTATFPTYTSAQCPRYPGVVGANCDRRSERASDRPPGSDASDPGPTTLSGSATRNPDPRLLDDGQPTSGLVGLLIGPIFAHGRLVVR